MTAESVGSFLETYRHMVASRYTDHLQAAAAQRGESFFYVPSSGHEASAALARHLITEDWLHLHYRDRALAYARGVSYESIFHDLFSRAASSSAGCRMPGFPCDRALNIMSTPTLVGSSALQAVGAAQALREKPGRPIVVASVGDGATQQGDFYEAVAEAVRTRLPVLFLIEDNRFALSTRTKGATFYSRPDGDAESFYGLPIHRVDGSSAPAADEAFEKLVSAARSTRAPQLLLFNVERLESHSNADDQSAYRTEADLRRATENADPCERLRRDLMTAGVAGAQIDEIEAETKSRIDAAFHTARDAAAPTATPPAKKSLPTPRAEYGGGRENRSHSMLEAMRATLRHQLENDRRTTLIGQDIEDPKGDVFGLTRGLSQDFPGRVRNSALAENTILGVSTGLALAGQRPIAFMQFADFLPVAYNHILSEIGAMHWRTAGQWDAPVTIMAISGGYRRGLGPYHAQTMEALCAHVPGVDVFMPSTAADAAGLLNAIAESGRRPAVFLFPKTLINDRTRSTTADVERHYVPIGKARIARAGRHLTLLSWGGAMPVCEQTAEALADIGVEAEVIDLRTIFPWDEDTVVKSARRTGRLVVVHEDNRTGGMGGEIAATVAERIGEGVQVVRVVRPDTYIPYDFSRQVEVLPSFRRTLETCCRLLDIDIHWDKGAIDESGLITVKAIGSSPSDETLTVSRLPVHTGETVQEGELIASVEADKAAMDISAPTSGTVQEVLAGEGDVLAVGAPLLTLFPATVRRPREEETLGTPVMVRRRPVGAARAPVPLQAPPPVYLSGITTVFGARRLANDELLKGREEWDSEAIRRRTGIESRCWIGEGENVLTLAVRAARALLEKEQLDISDIGALICSTGTPLAMTPSLACQVLHELSPGQGEVLMQAHDVNAACSGYMYALQPAFDCLGHSPLEKVMVITAETLSPMVNRDDQKTYPLFGDAATASLVGGERPTGSAAAKIDRPVLSATGVDRKVLYVPNLGSGEVIEMEGLTVFRLAVRKMIDMLDQACARRGMTTEDLDFIVPHQANERIIEAIRKTLHFPPEKVFNHIRKHGNTSSNTIPVALAELLPELPAGARVGLTAFGGGFTFGAAVIEKV